MTIKEMQHLSEEELEEAFEAYFPILRSFQEHMGEELTQSEAGVLLFFAKWLQEHSDMTNSDGKLLS